MNQSYSADVMVTPRAGILDPQGKAIEGALHSLDFAGVADVRVGKLIRLRIEAGSEAEARKQLTEMCARLLANPVTEDFSIAMREAP